MNLAVIIIPIAISLITLITVIYQFGRWAESMEQTRKTVHDFRGQIQSFGTKFVGKEIHDEQIKNLNTTMIRLETTLSRLERTNNMVLIALGKKLNNEDTDSNS